MTLDLATLEKLFEDTPEPVFYLDGPEILYRNAAGAALLPEEEETPQPFLQLLPEGKWEGLSSVLGGLHRLLISSLPDGRLVQLRSLQSQHPLARGSELAIQLRRQLASIMAACERLTSRLEDEEQLSPEFLRLLSIQEQGSHRLQRMIRQLDLEPDDWAGKYACKPLSFGSLLGQMLDELAARLYPGGPQLQLRIAPGVLPVEGNRELLQFLLLTLLSNALQSAGEEGKLMLRLTAVGSSLTLVLRDSGEGPAPAELLQVFAQKQDSKSQVPQEGLGFDLWLCQRIVAHHGGSIAVCAYGEGMEFTLSLPLTKLAGLRLESVPPPVYEDGFSPLLIGLSEALPTRCFDPRQL